MSRNLIYYKNWTFDQSKIAAWDLYLAAPLVGLSLPALALEYDTLSLTLRCTDPAIAAPPQSSPLRWTYRGRELGRFYIQKVRRVGENLYQLQGVSLPALLDGGRHRGGMYTGQPASAVVAEICGGLPHHIKSSLAGVPIYGWLPISSRRANLAQVLLALGACARSDLEGFLRIEPVWDGVGDALDWDNLGLEAGAVYADPVTRVELTEHQFTPSQEVITLFEGTAQQGDDIPFDEPVHSLEAEGFSVLESGPNYAILSAGAGVLTGKRYFHTTRLLSQQLSSGEESVREVADCTLLTPRNAQGALERTAAFYRCTQSVEGPALWPEGRAGDLLRLSHPFGGAATAAWLHSAQVSLSNVLLARTKMVVDFVPPPPGLWDLDTMVTLTASGSWTVPAGVEYIRVALISGGRGGYSGCPGGAAPIPQLEDWDRYNTGSEIHARYYRANLGGSGGEPGEGGEGGKVLEISLRVTPGQIFQVVIGAGGLGGPSGEDTVQGTEGGATTFGSYTSAHGTVRPYGYLVEGTGQLVAVSGSPGVAGGSGSGHGKVGTWVDIPGTPVTSNGQTWNPGANNETRMEEEDGKNGYSSFWVYSEGGYGGGAAVGSNGGDGTDPSATGVATVYDPPTRGIARGATGGKGADASPPLAATGIGAGGSGGNGGGGAGSAGTAYTEMTTVTGNAVGVQEPQLPTPASAGLGSAGGTGGPGGVLIWYAQPKNEPFGWAQDKNQLWRLDRHGRRCIV